MDAFLEFMTSPAGIAIFTVVALIVVIFIVAVNYRFFAKAFLDFLFGLITFIVLSPATLVCAVIAKANTGKAFEGHWIVGNGGRPVKVFTFADFTRGDRPSYISRSVLRCFPLLIAVLSGKMSLIGPSPLSLKDGALIADEYEERFSVRPGILSPAISIFPRRPVYEEMFAVDCEYAKKRTLFADVRTFLTALLRTIRGERGGFLSVGRDGYAEELLSRGAITREQYGEAEKLAADSLDDLRREKSRVG